MSKLDTAPYKGVRDFYPEDMKVQNYIFRIWRAVSEKFGYEEYSASILEPADLYRSKTSEEIVNEQTFNFIDRGGRDVVLRPEMTPTLARMVAAKHRELKFPLRWFSIPNVFRYEQPQRGRKREHWQLNCDVMGISGIEAEAEIISLAHSVLIAFGAKEEDFEVRINSRKVMFEVYKPILRNEVEWPEVCRFLDKKDKLSDEEQKEGIERYFSKPFDEDDATNKYSSSTVDQLLRVLKDNGINNAKLDPNLMRGFDYYTDIVFEIFDTHSDNRRSICGGGRYDNLLENFGIDPIPTVGFGMGDITIRDFLETHSLKTSD